MRINKAQNNICKLQTLKHGYMLSSSWNIHEITCIHPYDTEKKVLFKHAP